MRSRKTLLALVALLFLVAGAFASASYALRPLIYKAEKEQEIRHENRQFYLNAEAVQKHTEEHEETIYAQLLLAMRDYNKRLFENRQDGLSSREATEEAPFLLQPYGLPDEVFGVIRIPAMDVEMPVYLGASEENMANGAAVLSQTSIPIGGSSTNAVIAGHRGYSGYKYFMDIEMLHAGDKVYLTNLWEELVYEVREIRIVYPDDVEAILIQPGRDLLTLMTCHPYASGGKYRYLVYCERCLDDESSGGEETVLLP